MNRITTPDMELALASYFNIRTNLIVPNVSWGMSIHECDLLIITKSGYMWEVEIKISKADLIKDKEKEHNHFSPRIKHLYFAVPDYLLDYRQHIPSHAGIISVYWHDFHGGGTWLCKKVRKPGINSTYKVTAEEHYQIARLATMRMWDLKHRIRELSQQTTATK